MAGRPEDLGLLACVGGFEGLGFEGLQYQPYERLGRILRAGRIGCRGKLESGLAGGRRADAWRGIVGFHSGRGERLKRMFELC